MKIPFGKAAVGLIGQTVTFEVKARLPHGVPGSQRFKAKMLIDQSAPSAPGAAV